MYGIMESHEEIFDVSAMHEAEGIVCASWCAGVLVDQWCDGVDLAVSPWTGCRPSARRCCEAHPHDVEIRLPSFDCIGECRRWSSIELASQAASSKAATRIVRCTCLGALWASE